MTDEEIAIVWNEDGDDDKEPMWLLPKNYDYTVIPHVVHETPLTDEKAFWGE